MAFLKSVLYVIFLGIAAHYVGEALPRKWFVWDRFPYRTWRWERNGKIYDVLGVRAWKDKVPDMSRVMKDMVPKRVGRCPKSKDVYILVKETCVAEAVHVALCLVAFPIYLFWRNQVGVLLTAIFIICNLPFIIIQRYNRPTLLGLAKRLEQREERRRHACTDPVGEHRRGT